MMLSLSLAIFSISIHITYFGILTYFFGVWGGVEIGRHIESRMNMIYKVNPQ